MESVQRMFEIRKAMLWTMYMLSTMPSEGRVPMEFHHRNALERIIQKPFVDFFNTIQLSICRSQLTLLNGNLKIFGSKSCFELISTHVSRNFAR